MKIVSIIQKTAFSIFIALSAISCSELPPASQGEIKITNSAGDYWLTVADRNSGAMENSSTSYGDYYSRMEASNVCRRFKSSDNSDGWRLPTRDELEVI